MKASDLEMLQRKLLKLQKELNTDRAIDQEQETDQSNYKQTPYENPAHFGDQQFRISDFDISTTLGTGTFGRVRIAKLKNDPTHTVYALKMLKKTEIIRLNQVEHIKSERRILEEINHPFLVKL